MKELIANYFLELDISIEILSQRAEKHIPGLPSWVLSNRRIRIGEIKDKNFITIKVIPDKDLESDIIEEVVISNDNELQSFSSPWKSDFKIDHPPKNPFGFMVGDMQVIEQGNINAVPTAEFNGIIGILSNDEVPKTFSIEKAKKDAINFCNNAINNFPKNSSFLDNLRKIFDRFGSIIKRKAFLERRIHRYIKEYAKFLLPEFRKSFFDHELMLHGEKRIADIIMQRETGLPALLVELENPAVQMFKKGGELTAEANHARNQISEWVRFIEQNPENTQGEMNFLNGPKERLVIMNRGFEHLEAMVNSKYTDTIMWTYDLFLKEAKDRWNGIIIEQCKLLGISNPNILH